MKDGSRLSIAKISTIISIFSQVLSLICSFILRKVLILTLGIGYVGLYATLCQVIGALSITEFGMQAVVTFKLYKCHKRSFIT